jgi:tRNA uridine 5-carboxymethylaminomethyl modification enzyme
VVRFPHHEQHTIFLEPEGLETDSIYVNGLSTSLPEDIQERVVRAVAGMEKAAFLRYGYAVEYDVVAPRQMRTTLESREVPGLFCAGQLVGTSGYEEAAALGFVAGVNAVLGVRGEGEFSIGREDAYMGVLVDDVCGREHREPYRMFTSRAEHRLVLGVDSARERLMARGHELGLVPPKAFHVEQRRWERRQQTREALDGARVNPDRATREEIRRLAGVDLTTPTTWGRLLRRNDVDALRVARGLPEFEGFSDEDRRIVIGLLRYDGYLARHERERERMHRLRDVAIPEDLDFREIPGISREVAEAIEFERPRTLADAERVAGMTPAAVALIAGRIARGRRSS